MKLEGGERRMGCRIGMCVGGRSEAIAGLVVHGGLILLVRVIPH